VSIKDILTTNYKENLASARRHCLRTC